MAKEKFVKTDKKVDPLKKIRKDERLIKFKSMLEGGLYSFDTEKHIKEIRMLHSTREIRTMRVEDLIYKGHKKLLKVVNEEVANRSRVVEIKMDVQAILEKLEDHVDRMKRYLISTYDREMNAAGQTTVSARNDYTRSLLDKGFQQIAHLKSLNKFAEIVIDDIDQGKWRVNSITTILELNLQRERTGLR